MSEWDTISCQEQPNTIDSLCADFIRLGLQPGQTVLVHSSLSRLGWVCGGAVAVVQALMEVITPQGTLAMPTHSGDLCDPARWTHPPVPTGWWQTIRETMPAFNPEFTPTREMGKISEVFRTMPGVIRSCHPTVSFAAWGRWAEQVTGRHALAESLGEGSPLARIYDLDGKILLLGVGFGNNTSFHLAEARAHRKKYYVEGSPIWEDGRRKWQTYQEIEWNDEPFEEIGAAFESSGAVVHSQVGMADARYFSQRSAVDFAVQWLDAGESPSV